LHDCELLIERIANDPDDSCLLDESSAGERSVYLMSVSGWTITGCQIDPGVEAMLGLFAEPRSCSEVTGLLNEIGLPRIDAGYFAPLVNSGILVARAHATSGKGRTAAP
jgi:hypothetical protein